jgi:serine phosphatase RsbU (regulator of sigma subunit)/PAS domain-containing protein
MILCYRKQSRGVRTTGGAALDGSSLPRLTAGPRTEMHQRVLALVWSATPLGPIEQWSPTLQGVTVTCLESRVPMLLMLGPELVMVYNDAYGRMLGARHPAALGRTVPEVWPDVWPTIAPLVDRTLAGDSTYDEDLPLPMTRRGFEEEAWFTFSYSPVREPDGRVVAVLDTALETTRSVLAVRRLDVLRRLGSLPRSRGPSANEACAAALRVLAENAADVPFAAAYLLRRDRSSMRRAAGYGVTFGAALSAEAEAWVHEAMATRAPVTVSGLRDRHPRALRVPAGPMGEVDVDTVVTLPMSLAGRDQPVGALVVGTSPRLVLDDEHRTFLHLVAGQVAAAVTDARALKQEIERADERSAVERARTRFFNDVAVTLQRAVLGPTVLPPGFATHYEPASRTLEVGGDWYDVVDLRDGRYGIVVGDVVGRGLDAAAVMGQLRSAGRALLLESRSPAQVLAALDRYGDLVPGAACSTVFCAVVDPGSGVLRYSSAGHLPALLAHPSGEVSLLDAAAGLPLCVDGRDRPEAEVVLGVGATLALYTDGLVERRGADLDQGIARAAAVLAAARHRPADEVVGALTGELLIGQRDDDVAVLVYQRHP